MKKVSRLGSFARSTAPLLAVLLASADCTRVDPGAPGQATAPISTPGLLAFWDFQEPAGSPRVSRGSNRFELEEMNGPIARVEDGVFGPYAADFQWGQWFRIPRRNLGPLDIHGDDRQVSMVAWVKRESDRPWQYIAGVWNELNARRQYALIMSGQWQTDHTTYTRTPAENPAMGYVSAGGGATPGHPFAFDYATGGTVIQKDRWYMLAYTFDGEVIRVYVDGRLDENGNQNPFRYDGPIFDGGREGADFTVALRPIPAWSGYPAGVPNNQAGFDGRIAGLAVYDRALAPGEISALYRTTLGR